MPETESLIISDTAPEPITIGVEKVPNMIVNGVPTSWRTEIAVLVPRVRVTETRGYLSRPTVPANSSSVLTNASGTFHFEQEKIAYEARRINEADMWRLVKTHTIQALYVNGEFVAGKTSF